MKTTMALLALLGFTACSTSEPASEPQSISPEPGVSAAELPLEDPAAALTVDQSCRRFMRRQRSCTAQFIPALVAARIEQDKPSGIAAHAREVGREELVSGAFREWDVDSQETNIGVLCDDIAQALTPEKDTLLRNSMGACLVQDGCDAFVSCAVPLSLTRWRE